MGEKPRGFMKIISQFIKSISLACVYVWLSLNVSDGLAQVVTLPEIKATSATKAEKINCPTPAPKLSDAQIDEMTLTAPDRGFLWRLQKDGRTSWLYGTVHIGKMDWAALGPQVTKALRAADTLAVEIDFADPVIKADLAQIPASVAVTPVLSANQLARLEKLTSSSCLSDAQLKQRPAIFRLQQLEGQIFRYEGFYPEFGLESTLKKMATKWNKPTVSLELLSDYRKLTQGVTSEQHLNFFEQTLSEMERDRFPTSARKMMLLWSTANWDGFRNYQDWCNCRDKPVSDSSIAVNDGRNQNMAERLNKLLESGKSVFAAVGALHMLDDTGLPELMKAKGYSVERIVSETTP